MNFVAAHSERESVAEKFLQVTRRLEVIDRGDFHANTRLEFVLEQLRYLYRIQAGLPKLSLAKPELPFDRFLLSYSQHYLQTRKIAEKIGCSLVPEVVSLSRSLTNFSPSSARIEFSPLRSELNWLLTSNADRKTRLSVFSDLTKITSCAFHDLNHSILFRLLRPQTELKNSKSIAYYYTFIESLVILRDLMLADELGPIGLPLKTLGVVYRNNSRPKRSVTYLSFEEFYSYFSYTYLSLLGFSKTKARAALKHTGIRFTPHPALDTNQDFIDHTHAYWMKKHFKQFGRRLVLPKKAKRGALRIQIRFSSELAQIEDREQMYRVYLWMRDFFEYDR